MAGKKKRKNKMSLDWLLLVTLLALLAYGLLILYSATFYVEGGFWTRQLKWVGLGIGVLVLMATIPYTIWQKLVLPMMLATLLMLIITVFFGKQILGAQRSIVVFGISIQPGVLARLVAVIYIAAWLTSKGEQLHQMRYGLAPFAVIMGIVTGLVALQPDLSTALLLAATGLVMFFFAGGDPIQIFLSVTIAASTFGLMAWRLEHARDRMINYAMAWKDPTQMSYHVYRAIMAISSGGLLGVGIGNGRLKAGYLPIPHTDSIFAVLGEEVGLIGALLVIVLFGFFAYRGYRIALETPDPFGSLVAFGVTTMIVGEALLNIMVIVGLVPFTGTALPFFSYGGSEMLVTMTGVGLLLGISRGKPKGDWDAILDRWWRDWWSRISSPRRRTSYAGR